MKLLGLLIGSLLLIVSSMASASTYQGFVQVRPNRYLFVNYQAPRPGFPTVVLLNGLTYSTVQFEAYAQALETKGLGVLRFDFDGMGKSLLRYAPSMAAYPYDQQANDLKAILTAMRIPPPYNLAGLSYGGGIGVEYALKFPGDVRNLILISPYTEVLSGPDQTIKTEISWTRITFPLNPATDEQLYDYFFHQIVYATYPAAEPNVLENPFILEAVYNLARGIRPFRPVDFAAQLPPGTVHLMVAANDQYIPRPVLNKFWGHVNPAARMSRVLVEQSEHKITAAFPGFTAAWTWQIIKGNPVFHQGRDFDANPVTMQVMSNGQQIPIND